MMFLLANWKTILGIVATAALAYLLHTMDVNRLEAKERADIAAQQTADAQSCNADKKITEEVSHDYEAKIRALNSQLDAIRLRPNVCVTVAPRPAAGRNATASVSKPARQNAGVDSDALFSIAAEGEHYRLQLIACQAFVTDTWKEKNQ